MKGSKENLRISSHSAGLRGCQAAKGQIVDANIVPARWTGTHGKSYFGYQNHITVDARGKFIRDYQVTAAKVRDCQVF